MIQMQTTVQRAVDVMAQRVDDDLVILNMANNNYIALDTIGRRVWELIEQPRTVDEVCAQLSREFAASAEVIAADVLPFLTELLAERLLAKPEAA